MRVGLVVQRYGATIAGGAEQAARLVASGLAARGHHVTVLTSCAHDYLTWANVEAVGETIEEGVIVRRLGVSHERDQQRFAILSARVLSGTAPAPLVIQREWQRQQGPWLDGFAEALDRLALSSDVVIFVTYLYATSTIGLVHLRHRVPTVLMTTLHDEPPATLDIVREAVIAADLLVTLTHEEDALVRTQFPAVPSCEIGLPVPDPGPGQRLTLDGLGLFRPYVLVLGRMDANKGVGAAIAWWQRLRARWPDAPELVLAGDPSPLAAIVPAPRLDGVKVLGLVSDAMKRALLEGAVALVHLSHQESFSLVLCEAWLAGCPVIVRQDASVAAGQTNRSGGGIAIEGPDDLDRAVRQLVSEPALRARLGQSGRQFVQRNYQPDVVIDRWELALADAIARHGADPVL
jgi:glycosyltransferase involved in cell wall biosynthesis